MLSSGTAAEPKESRRVSSTNDERGARLSRVIAAAISGDTSQLHALLSDDVIASGPVIRAASRSDLADEVARRLGAFSDRKVAVAPLDVAGDQACVEWVATGVHTGPFHLDRGDTPVIEPTGRRVRIRAITVAEFDGDQIRSFRSYWDDVSLLAELGALSAR
jgi:ketosteroid isomerase-like protein